MAFDFLKLFVDVFHPEEGERVLVMTDEPGSGQDSAAWRERREMAAEWHDLLVDRQAELGIEVLPFVTFPATGGHNADLPLKAGDPISLEKALSRATAVVAPTEFSSSAPMVAWCTSHEDTRAATLPGVARRTEGTALSADYGEVARRCERLRSLLDQAVEAKVTFDTGHEWQVDLRYRTAMTDDGQLSRDKASRVINLPGGEGFQVPYEGERDGEPSGTAGKVPVALDDDVAVFIVEQNCVVDVEGMGREAQRLRTAFAEEPAHGNIAEFAFGCNPEAVVWGNVLEDEKAGFHWAYGRSEHLGGTVGPEAFSSPDRVLHQDIVYAKDSAIKVTEVTLIAEDGAACAVIRDGDYVVFDTSPEGV
ncbi:MAG: hypothetical protein CME26_04560 [Gemmatimonadetes bacterium]|nr:hypothetical protein [Gemmatimonadota bacterium]